MVDIAVSVLPRAPFSLEKNVNRFRTQLKLQPLDKHTLETVMRTIEVAGQPGQYFDIAGTDEQRILVVTLPRGESVWFFKMVGDAQLVAQQRF